MKRFIDLRDQITDVEDEPVEFAFYCTVVDRFEEFSGEQTWTSREEFIQDFEEQQQNYPAGARSDLNRYLALMPDWVESGRVGKQEDKKHESD